MKICEIKQLISEYGELTTLGCILKKVQGNRVHKCPKCNGKGNVSVKYNAYPPGFPDSRFVEDWRYKDVTCDLCDGEGYTEHVYKPKMVQDGWE